MSHLVLWVSRGVLVLFLVGVCFVLMLEDTWLFDSPILQYVGIANQRQNVLMTVRASSVQGMSSKTKNIIIEITLFFTNNYYYFY